jgi:ubiquitin C-terminal hydrolase
MNNKVVRATNRLLFEKLPNILMLNLKRFIWTDRLVKKKEHVWFNETLEIQDNHVSQHLEIGIFKKASQHKSHRKYRLYSIIEHIGNTG